MSSSKNDVCITGNLTRDPELKYIPNGTAVVNFTVAVNRSFKKTDGEWEEETTFVDCEAWSSGAERFAEKNKKGDPVLIDGSLRNESWEAQDGTKRSKMKVRVNKWYQQYRRPTTNGENVSEDETTTVVSDNDAPVPAGDIPF